MPDHALPSHPLEGRAEPTWRPSPLWLVRPRDDGGNDFVSFRPSPTAAPGSVEMREGSHLPPQLPLLKRRRHLAAAEAEACGRRLLQEGGYRRSKPLF